jgi:hypothetical protein
MKMDDQKIGERLLRFGQEKKLSQAEFAGRLGVSPGAYKNMNGATGKFPLRFYWRSIKNLRWTRYG